MMRPPRWRIIGFSTACVSAKAAVRFVASTASQSSRFIRSINWSRAMPALLTRMSIRPCRSSVAGDRPPRSAPASVTSSAMASACPPARANLLRDRAARCRRARPRRRSAPRAASCSAIARPMPRDAPVTSATRSERSIILQRNHPFVEGPRGHRPLPRQRVERGESTPRPRRSRTVTRRSIFLISPASTVAGPELDERASRPPRSAAGRHPPSAPATTPAGSARRSRAGVALRLGVDVGDDRDAGIRGRQRAQLRRQPLLRRLHQRAMERRADRQRQSPASRRAPSPARRRARRRRHARRSRSAPARSGSRASRRGRELGRRLGARRARRRRVEPEDRRHRAFADRHRFLHVPPAAAHRAQGIREG